LSKWSVPVRRHHDQIDVVRPREFDDHAGRLA